MKVASFVDNTKPVFRSVTHIVDKDGRPICGTIVQGPPKFLGGLFAKAKVTCLSCLERSDVR